MSRGRARARRRRRAAAALAVAVVAALALAGGVRLLRWRPQPPEAPTFSLAEAGGGSFALVDVRGRPVALVFFRTFFSRPARQYLVELERAYPRVRSEGAELAAITVAPLDQVRAGKQELGLTFPVLADPDHLVAERYGVYDRLGDGLAGPAVFVLDGAGRIRWRYVGSQVGDRPAAREVLAQLRRAAGR